MENIKEWIKVNYKNNISTDMYEQTTAFPIIWNFYENCLWDTMDCNNFKKVKDIALITKDNISDSEVNTLFNTLINYLENRFNKNYIYSFFGFRERRDIDKDSFDNLMKSNNKLDRIEFLIWISYRVRNNMFHGVKDLRSSHEMNMQIVLFECINNFLILSIKNMM